MVRITVSILVMIMVSIIVRVIVKIRVRDPRWIASSAHCFGSVSLFFSPCCFSFVDVANLIGQGIDPIGFAKLKRVHFHAPLGSRCSDMFAFPHIC